MVAPLLKITDTTGTVAVDMTRKNPSFTFTGINPFIVVTPPNPSTGSATGYSNFNAAVINLAMFTPKISISFTESPIEGAGTGTPPVMGLGDDPFKLDGLSTTFQMLLWMFQIDKSRKRLYVNSPTNYVLCHISSYRATLVAGQGGLVNHTLELTLAGEISP